MIVGFVSYAYFVFFPVDSLHWLHMYFISFTWSVMVMLLFGYLKPKTQEEIEKSDERNPAPVDMTPWPKAKEASIGILSTTVIIYLLLSLAST